MNSKADFFFNKASQWQQEYEQLRKIVLDTGLIEDLKWGCPCYTYDNRNIVLIHGFKEYCALLFFKGALMQNANGLLIQQTKNVQAARQMRFTSVAEITKKKALIKAAIYEAIEVEKAGLKVELKKPDDFPVPEEFENVLKARPKLQAAFNALTSGRQKAYLFYFSQPKQSKTRVSRIEKSIPQILAGKGLND
jgi:uncharacterized protein YdeI (YjbR/CyaY-like superfamily)